MRHLSIAAIVRLLRIIAMMAVMMVRHISTYIRLIVIQINRFRLLVITRPVTVIVR